PYPELPQEPIIHPRPSERIELAKLPVAPVARPSDETHAVDLALAALSAVTEAKEETTEIAVAPVLEKEPLRAGSKKTEMSIATAVAETDSGKIRSKPPALPKKTEL